MSPAGARLLADTEAFRAKCGAKLAAKTASAGTQMGQVSMMAGIASMATGGVASQAIGAGATMINNQIRNKATSDVMSAAAAMDC